jgi:DNA polymerase (family 10)
MSTFIPATTTANAPPAPTITNKTAADLLFDVATILELSEDNPYRVRAYRRAARLLLRQQDQASVHLDEKGELVLPGLGPRLRRKLGELLSTGRMGFYVELCAELPDAIAELMRIPTVGPKTAWRLHAELGLSTAEDVRRAAANGEIRTLYGFGEVREQQLLAGATEVLAGRPKVYSPVPLDLFEQVDEPAPLPAGRSAAPIAIPAQVALPRAA